MLVNCETLEASQALEKAGLCLVGVQRLQLVVFVVTLLMNMSQCLGKTQIQGNAS